MSDPFGDAISAMTSATTASTTETATSDTSASDTSTSPGRTASSGESRAEDSSALSSQSSDATQANAAPQIDDAIRAAVRAELEADEEYRPFFDLRNQMTGGELSAVMPQLQALANNPVAFYRELEQQLREAGMLQAPQVETLKPFAMPDGDLRSEDGIPAYSAKALATIVDGLRSEFDAQLKTRFEPIESERQSRAESEKQQQRLNAAMSEISSAEKTLEGFKDLKPQIYELLKADNAKAPHLRQFGNNLWKAYFHVRSLTQPTLEAKARQTVVSDLQKKAAASTTQAGQRVNGGIAKPPKDFKDLPTEQLLAVAQSFGR